MLVQPHSASVHEYEVSRNSLSSQQRVWEELCLTSATVLNNQLTCSPASTSSTNDSDGAAGDANQGIDIVDHDTEESKLLSDTFVFGGAACVTTADRASSARAGWRSPTCHVCRSGDRKSCESSSDKDELLGEHGCGFSMYLCLVDCG